jgi:outer membrane immunogenic protein
MGRRHFRRWAIRRYPWFPERSFLFTEGREKLRTSYAAGVRLGYLVAPNVLSYVNGGYSGSEWSGTSQTFVGVGPVVATRTTTPSFHRDGWFVGGGVERTTWIFSVSQRQAGS